MNLIDGYNLLHQGVIALAEVEANGMHVDVAYLDKAIIDCKARVKRLRGKLMECEEYKLQRRRFGTRVNLTSREQLAAVLFGDMDFKSDVKTATGKQKLDEEVLDRIGTKYVRGFIKLEKLNKLVGTYLVGIRREVVGDLAHTFFGLHRARSYRGQSDSPNFQNIPIRDPEIGKIIRQAFTPRPGHAIIEIDYSSMEVRIACALSGDPKLTFDTVEGDMHRDMAAESYMLAQNDVMKNVRQDAKGGFVFAEFYGDWYKQVTQNLWDAIGQNGLTTKAGVCLYEHLASKGIRAMGECDNQAHSVPGTFEHHIRQVEDRFWNDRYKVYRDKRRAWVDEYNRQGYIDIQTGFRCQGPMTKNQVMNYHIQGPAFHGLLWSLISMVKEIKKRGMGAKIVSQIHDSIIADVPLCEVDDYLELANNTTTRKLREHWDWLTVELEIEAEMSPISWHDKKEVKLK